MHRIGVKIEPSFTFKLNNVAQWVQFNMVRFYANLKYFLARKNKLQYKGTKLSKLTSPSSPLLPHSNDMLYMLSKLNSSNKTCSTVTNSRKFKNKKEKKAPTTFSNFEDSFGKVDFSEKLVLELKTFLDWPHTHPPLELHSSGLLLKLIYFGFKLKNIHQITGKKR
jgi:hypothetical protein